MVALHVAFSTSSRRFVLMSASEVQPVTHESTAREGCECHCAAIDMGMSTRERASAQAGSTASSSRRTHCDLPFDEMLPIQGTRPRANREPSGWSRGRASLAYHRVR